MNRKRQLFTEIRDDDILATQFQTVVMTLKKQLRARKKVYFRYKGVVTDVREVRDHMTQLRALVELIKVMGLYPR
jgi:hypothetical protein